VAVAAARGGCRVIGIDMAPNLVEEARGRASREGLEIDYREADAEALPFGDGEFDLVASMFGVMFVARPGRAAAELARVTRPGGRVALANWTEGGVVGEVLRRAAARTAPPAGTVSPLIWGDPERVRGWMRAGFVELACSRRMAHLKFDLSPADVVEFIRCHYGPLQRAFAGMETAARRDLREDLVRVFERANLDTNGGTVVRAEYLEMVWLRE
jgi:SAM-dependent methyltransferase